MNRTSALRRLGVPVLAATALLTGGQIALGTSAFAVTPGTIAITPNPGYGTVTPSAPGTPTHIENTVTYTPGAAGPQTIQLQVTGSATLVAPTAPPTVTGTFVAAAGGKTATCTTDASNTCRFAVTDTTSEAVTVQAVDTTDNTVQPTTATDNFASLYWSNCSQTTQNTFANCVTQTTVGQSTTYTVTYKTAGQPAAGVTVIFADNSHADPNGVFTAGQPAGSTHFSSTQVDCTTNAQGQCSVTILDNTAEAVAISAITSNTGNYPASEADMTVNIVASAVPGRLVPVANPAGIPAQIQPSTQTNGLNMPGDVVAQTYKLESCGTGTGTNVCPEGTPLAGVSVALSIDHGFFTPACTGGPTGSTTTSYANCSFNTTPAAGTKVGDLKNSGTTMTVTTDNSGQFTVFIGMAKDSGFDDDGLVNTTVTAVANGVTLTPTNAGTSPSGTTCGAATAGCPSTIQWSTQGAPLNGGSLKVTWITTPALSDTSTNEVQIGSPAGTEQQVFVLSLTDQFGNLTTAGGNNVTLTATGAGELYNCVAPGPPPATPYTSTNPCVAKGGANFTQPSGTPTYTINNASGSYSAPFTAAGNAAQSRFGVDSVGSLPSGTQTLKATWNAPITTFSSYFAATTTTAAFATYDNSKTNTLTDTVTIDYYTPVATTTTFATTPGNRVAAGTVVTVSTTVKDQHGQGIQNLVVQFIRSGPQTESGTSCSATNVTTATGSTGGAGFSFTCTNPSQQVVTIVIRDANGAEVARGTQTINFTGTTPPATRKAIAAVIKCISPSKHTVRCKVVEAPKFAGLTVTFRHQGGKWLGVSHTNSNGVAYLTIRNLKSHSWFAAFAKVAGTGKTKPATTNLNGVRVR